MSTFDRVESAGVPDDIAWTVPPQFQGQIVEVAFGIVDEDNYIWARNRDRSDNSITYYRRPALPDDELDFWNCPPDEWE